MSPKHIRHIKYKSLRAVAPYNFVELPDRVIPAKPHEADRDRYASDKLTGRLKCTLTTSSPLYIRGGFTPEDFAKHGDQPSSLDYVCDQTKVKRVERDRRADFFTQPGTGRPAIPASSLRGMLRTLVEIASYSKIDKVTDTQLVYRAVGDPTSLGDDYRNRLTPSNQPQQQAGYLVQQGSAWFIKPAKEIFGAPFARIENSHQNNPPGLSPWNHSQNAFQGKFAQVSTLSISGIPLVEATQSGHIDGVWVRTGEMIGKKMDIVIGEPDSTQDLIPISYELVEKYKGQLTKAQESLLGSQGALQSMQPVFYIEEYGELTFFGHALMFRLPYQSSLKAFIPSHLRSDGQGQRVLDIAEVLFGYVADQKQTGSAQSLKGRLEFSDATRPVQSDDKDIWLTGNHSTKIIPNILSSPKPTTFQHYLVQPEKTQAKERQLKHYTSEPEVDTVIRGHKLYWHQGDITTADIKAKLAIEKRTTSSQHTEIKPIKSDVSFEFDIHFENLESTELGALLWVLDIAQKDEYRLSLGMGKPLGMGAIKVMHTLQLSNRRSRYQTLFEHQAWAECTDTEISSNSYIEQFEAYASEQLELEPGTFRQQDRIQMLLAMLSWSESVSTEEKNRLRYMEIERSTQEAHVINRKNARRGKVNEYKRRPVLPTPLDVEEVDLEETPPREDRNYTQNQPRKEKKWTSANKGSGQNAFAAAFERAKKKPKKK